jgi:hypothetical protein
LSFDKWQVLVGLHLASKFIAMNNLPNYIAVVFGLTTLLTVALFYKAANKSKTTLIILLAWLLLQGLTGLSGFYTVTDNIPPRFVLLVLPPVITIILLFATNKSRQYIDSLDVKTLTILHVVRVPVEVVLLWLSLHQAIPKLMTFEGRNFDIVSGLAAPIIYYYGFIKNRIGRKFMIIWNLLCLALLINIVVHAILSAPFPFQQFAFDQPNVALLYFPYVWLPCCIVPLVLLAHLTAMRQLLAMRTSASVNKAHAFDRHVKEMA